MTSIKIVKGNSLQNSPARDEVSPMSKQDRMLNHPDIREYMELYNAYLDGDRTLGPTGAAVEQVRLAEENLRRAGYSRDILQVAREHVKKRRIQIKRGRNGASV